MSEPDSVTLLAEWVCKLHHESWEHARRQGFRLGEATPLIASNHLIEEAAEFQAEVMKHPQPNRAAQELADVLGVVVHAAQMIDISMNDLAVLCMELRENFREPSDV